MTPEELIALLDQLPHLTIRDSRWHNTFRDSAGKAFTIPGYDGSYPDKSKDRKGIIVGEVTEIVIYSSPRVLLYGENEARGINKDVVRLDRQEVK